MDGVSLLVAVLIGGASILLMWRQLDVMRRQVEIMNEQHALLARRARLRLKAQLIGPTESDTNRYLELRVENDGDRAAHDFHWPVLVAVDFSQRQSFSEHVEGDVRADGAVSMRGQEFRRFHAHCERPVYPTRSLCIGKIAGDTAQPVSETAVHWQLVCEDGANPPSIDDFATTIVAATRGA